jgi:hypothetical protein
MEQKTITIDRTLIKEEISIVCLYAAMNKLDDTVFKLWTYILIQEEAQFALSITDFCKISGESQSTVERAVVELIEKGYLRLINKEKNTYIFELYPSNT